jgi:hypothetical protein
LLAENAVVFIIQTIRNTSFAARLRYLHTPEKFSREALNKAKFWIFDIRRR